MARAALSACGDGTARYPAGADVAGSGDLAEIATLCAKEHDVVLVGIVDHDVAGYEAVGGLPILVSSALGGVDAVIITNYREPQATFDEVRRYVGIERILFPQFLNVARVKPNFMA